MKNTLSWDEIQLLQYDITRLHNTLKGYEERITNDTVKTSLNNTLHDLERLITHIRTQEILE